MEKMTIALLSGGVSSEREVSLNSGNQVYDALDKEKYNIVRYDPKTDLGRLVDDAPGCFPLTTCLLSTAAGSCMSYYMQLRATWQK